MPLPTLVKTWQFRKMRVGAGTATNWGGLALQGMQALKDAFCDNLTGGYQQGNIQSVGGSVYRWNPNPGSSNTILDQALFGNLVGKNLVIKGATTGANDGTFAITAHTDLGSGEWVVDYTNAGGVAEVVNGHCAVKAGVFTNPMEVYQSAHPGSVGTAGDGIDRWWTANPWVGNTSNFSQITLRNPNTETYFHFNGNCDFSSEEFVKMGWRLALPPNAITFTNTTVEGVGTVNANGGNNHTVFNLENQRWAANYIETQALNGNIVIYALMSSDGEELRAWLGFQGNATVAIMSGTVRNPNPAYTAPGATTPRWATMRSAAGNNTSRWTYSLFNDQANVRVSGVTEPYGLSPEGETTRHIVPAYMTSEGAIDGAAGQVWSGASELSGKWGMYSIGLTSYDFGNRTRIGEVTDLWWLPTGVSEGVTFPIGGPGQFLCVGNFAVPWNNTYPEFA